MLASYFKIALKVLLRRKFFTFITLFAISFTLVVLIVSAAMFDSAFGPHEPESKLDRTLLVQAVAMIGPQMHRGSPPGYKFLNEYVRTLPNVERVSIASNQKSVTSYLEGKKISSVLKETDGEYWNVFSFEFIEGRPFTADDDQLGNRVAVINEATRAKFFAGAPAVGKTIELDGRRFTVVGVVRNVPITRFVPFSDIWTPIGTNRSSAYRNELLGGYVGIVVAKSRDDFPELKREFAARLKQVPLPDPKMYSRFEAGLETQLETIARLGMGQSNPAALRAVIAVLVFLFMLLPAVNLININVSRILERASEIGVRKAFGASSRTLVGQFVVENLVTTFAGGILALILAALVLELVNASALLPYSQLALNWRVFAYGMLFSFAFGLLSGVYPAFRMSRLDPVNALRGGAR